MISIDKLKKVKRIVVHRSCPDGLASAIILRSVLPEASIEFVQYGPEREGLKVSDGMLLCDMSPPDSRVQEFVDAGAIVLDHHEGSEKIIAKFGKDGVCGSTPDGVSGAVLAWREVWTQMTVHLGESPQIKNLVKEFAELVGIVDTWQKESPKWEEAQSTCCALMFYGTDYFLSTSYDRAWLHENELEVGKLIYQKRQKRARNIIDNQTIYTTQPGSFILGVFEDSGADKLVSDVAELMRQDKKLKDHVDICVGFKMVLDPNDEKAAPQWSYSLRSVNQDINVNLIAQTAGGGGHPRAAGLVSELGLEDPIRVAFTLIGRGMARTGQGHEND